MAEIFKLSRLLPDNVSVKQLRVEAPGSIMLKALRKSIKLQSSFSPPFYYFKH